MKIVFSGCSYTWGAELVENDKHRYSKIICDSLQASEVNLAVSGSANEAIFLRLVEYLENHTANYIVLQLTDVHRISIAHVKPGFFSSLNYKSKNSNGLYKSINLKIAQHLYYQGKDNTEAWYRMTRYKLLMLEVYLNSKNIPYVICVKNHDNELLTYMNDPCIPDTIKNKFYTVGLDKLCYGNRTTGVDSGHPNEQGHKLIAAALRTKLKECCFKTS